MKKTILFLLIIALFILPIPAQASGENWVTLESDATEINQVGQIINISLSGALAETINGAGVVLNYDSACLKVDSYQAGTLLPNAVGFPQDNAGSFDITYYYQGVSQAVAGEGSLLLVTFETIAVCETSISAEQNLITLDKIGDDGIALALVGVEYRDLAVNLGGGSASGTNVDGGLVPPINTSANPEQAAPEMPIEESSQSPATAPHIPSFASSSGMGILPIALILMLVILLPIFAISQRKKKKKENPAPQMDSFTHASDSPSLIEERGPQQGFRARLNNQRTLLGRHSNCQVQVKNNYISRQHAEITQQDGAYYLADVGSRNGTFLNDNRLNAGYHLLHDGDRVRLGKEATYRFAEPHGRTMMYAS